MAVFEGITWNDIFWSVEANAAGDEGVERGEFELEAITTDFEFEAAVTPKACFGVHEGGVLVLDENAKGGAAGERLELAAFDATDEISFEIDATADVDRAGFFGCEDEAEAGDGTRGERRVFVAFEDALVLATGSGIEFDVGTGDEGVETGDAGAGDAGANDPEAGAIADELEVFWFNAGVDFDMEFGVQSDVFDVTDFDVAAADFGFAGFDAFGVGEGDFDDLAFFVVASFDEPAAEEEAEDGNDPDDAETFFGRGLGLGRFGVVRGIGLRLSVHGSLVIFIVGSADAVPDEFGLERVGSEHGEDDGGAESESGAAGTNVHDVAKLDEANKDSDDKDIDHGPAADEFGELVNFGGATRIHFEATCRDEAKEAEGDEFERGNEDAGDENGDGNGVSVHFPKGGHAAEDGAFV